MAFEVYELYDSRKVNMGWDSQSATLEFYGKGVLDDNLARAGFLAVVPASFFGLLFKDMDVECIGGINWRCSAKYESTVIQTNPGVGGPSPPPPPPPAPGPNDPLTREYSVDISSYDEKITQSKETRYKVLRDDVQDNNNAPDCQGAIGLTADGKIEGAERISPKMEFSTTRQFGYVTLSYYKTLYSLVGKTNDDTFYGWDRGEVLFLGVSASSKDTSKVTLTYKFAISPNETEIYIEGDFRVPEKRGWDYLWVGYEAAEDGNKLIQRPFAAYVERIYDEADFSKLGIGT